LGRLDDHDLLYTAFGGLLGRGLGFNFLLGRILKGSRLHRAITKALDSVHDVIGLVVVSLAQRRCPRETVVHRFDYVGKLGQRSDAGIPGLGVYLFGEFIAFQLRILLKPAVRFHDLLRKRGRNQDTRYQQIGIQRDWGNQLFQLLGRCLSRRRPCCRFHRF
jgi:hypothetical protein